MTVKQTLDSVANTELIYKGSAVKKIANWWCKAANYEGVLFVEIMPCISFSKALEDIRVGIKIVDKPK